MSYQEKRSIVSLMGTIIIFAIYHTEVMKIFHTLPETEPNLTFWGSAVLILIPVLVIPKIVIHLLFNGINYIATKEEEPKAMDEMDKLIDLKATRNFYHVFMVGFLIAMGLLALDMAPMAFQTLLFSVIGSGIVMDISQLCYYRRGV